MNSPNGSVHLPPSGGEVGNGPFLPVGKTAKVVGSDLTSEDLADLEARWIDPRLALQAGLRRVDSLTGGEIVGRKGGNHAGIVIPYFHPGSDRVREYRLRRDHPELEYDSAGNLLRRLASTNVTSLDPNKGDVMFTADHLTPGATYYARVAGAKR